MAEWAKWPLFLPSFETVYSCEYFAAWILLLVGSGLERSLYWLNSPGDMVDFLGLVVNIHHHGVLLPALLALRLLLL